MKKVLCILVTLLGSTMTFASLDGYLENPSKSFYQLPLNENPFDEGMVIQIKKDIKVRSNISVVKISNNCHLHVMPSPRNRILREGKRLQYLVNKELGHDRLVNMEIEHKAITNLIIASYQNRLKIADFTSFSKSDTDLCDQHFEIKLPPSIESNRNDANYTYPKGGFHRRYVYTPISGTGKSVIVTNYRLKNSGNAAYEITFSYIYNNRCTTGTTLYETIKSSAFFNQQQKMYKGEYWTSTFSSGSIITCVPHGEGTMYYHDSAPWFGAWDKGKQAWDNDWDDF